MSTCSHNTSYKKVPLPTPQLTSDSNAATATPTPFSEELTYVCHATSKPFLEEDGDDDYNSELELKLLCKEDDIQVVEPMFTALDGLNVCKNH